MSHQDSMRRKSEDLARLDAMNDEDIDLSDMPEITDWSNAVRGLFSDSPQAEIKLRIDRDVIRWILCRTVNIRWRSTPSCASTWSANAMILEDRRLDDTPIQTTPEAIARLVGSMRIDALSHR